MSKNIKVVGNFSGGFDMIVEKDAGNPIFITTGKVSSSLKFWKDMKAASTKVVDVMTAKNKALKKT